MELRIRRATTAPLRALMALLVGLLSGCVVGGESEMDYPTYESVTSLAKNTDLVVIGTVGPILSREIDDGGNNNDAGGIPMTFYELGIDRTVASASSPRSSIVVAWPDLESEPVEGRSTLIPGDKVLLFADYVSADEAPGIDTQEEMWVPIGGNNGIFDVADDQVTARSLVVRRLSRNDTASTDRFTAPLSEVTAEVASATGG